MKKRYIFSLAALALLTAACSSDEMALNPADQPAPVEQKIPFTAVISADAAGTRALTEASDGKTITAKWEKEEKVALIHGEIIDVLEVSSVDATTGAATISGTITNPKNEETVYVVYVGNQHVNMSNYVSSLQDKYTSYKAYNPESSAIPTSIISEPVNELLATQDGKLETISNKHDYRFAPSTFAVSDGTATFASEVKMLARYAIWKLNLTTDGTTALKAKKLVMKKDGEADVTIEGTETSSEFYIAFIPSVQANAYTFSATTSDDKTYTCTPTVSALDGGKYYRSTLTMAAAATGNTYRVYTSGTAYTDEAIPSDAVTVTSTTTTWAAGTYVVSEDVTISGDVTLTGDVNLILSDGAELTVNGIFSNPLDNSDNRTYSMNIYGQSGGTGKLTMKHSAINAMAHNLNIHGGTITIKDGGVEQAIETTGRLNVFHGTIDVHGAYGGIISLGNMFVYGGTITASSDANTAAIMANHDLTISGGTINAQCTSQMEGILAGGTITINGGKVTAKGGAGGGIGLEGTTTISGGTVTAIGGDGVAGGIENGAAGYDGTLTVTGGELTATGGAKAGEGSNGSGISGTIELGDGIHLYTGTVSEPNPSSAIPDQTGPGTIDPAPESRYVVIQ